MEKKNLILNRILDEVFDACKQCIVDNYEEDEKEFKKLRARVEYESVEDKSEMTTKEFESIYGEIIAFLDSGPRYRDYEPTKLQKMIDDLFNDPVFKEYNKKYEETNEIDPTYLSMLIVGHKRLYDYLEAVYKIDTTLYPELTDEDLSDLYTYYDARRDQLEKVFKVDYERR